MPWTQKEMDIEKVCVEDMKPIPAVGDRSKWPDFPSPAWAGSPVIIYDIPAGQVRDGVLGSRGILWWLLVLALWQSCFAISPKPLEFLGLQLPTLQNGVIHPRSPGTGIRTG